MKNLFTTKRLKIFLIISSIFIAIFSLLYSHQLVTKLSIEEKNKVEVWAEAMRAFNTADQHTDLNLVLKVLNANNTIPVIVTDSKHSIQTYRNINLATKDTIQYLNHMVEELDQSKNYIPINMEGSDEFIRVYYNESLLLRKLAIYPYIQLSLVLVLGVITILALLALKRAEQNKVWVGLSKETAHQLGTPISSLLAWSELLKTNYPDDELLTYMSEDIDRLQMIANRFSKIGSKPELSEEALMPLLSSVITYISKRFSDKVKLELICNYPDAMVPVNSSLFGWVIENLCKNAIDAMSGLGNITIKVTEGTNKWIIDVSDTGKGIPRSKFESIFKPGFTTKKRGWGLGLSLARRIVEEYHHGRIFVKQSELNKGTIFRIELKK